MNPGEILGQMSNYQIMNKYEFCYLSEAKESSRGLLEKLFQHLPEALKVSPLV